jgi:hypothetical protein
LVGTKKGGFVCTADGTRKDWKIEGPLFGGWEIYHMKGSSADPNRIYASQSSGWFGQVIQRSDDGGKTWFPPGSSPDDLKSPEGFPQGESNKFLYEGIPGTHLWYDGTPHPWEFKRVWHVEPSLDDPDSLCAGVEDAALVLPHHLRNLAQVGGEVVLEVSSPETVASVLDALETTYPVLKGTIRDHGTFRRRDFVRFFADGEDISLQPADSPLPSAVTSGREPLLVIGAIAGG